MERKMYIKSLNDRVLIYMSSPKASEGYYMEYCLRHFQHEFSDGGTYQNQDVWRFYELYSFKEDNDGELIKETPYCILNGGEWECALRIKDTPDFHGGLHGYEHYKKVYATYDGKDLELETESELFEANKFEFTQCSEIYLQGTRDELIAEHVKHYTFENGNVTLNQELIWHKELTILYSYMAMLPIKRTSDNTPEGEQISDRAMLSNSDKIYDVTQTGHNTGISSVADHVRDITFAKVWGEKSGINAELSIKCDFLPTNNFFVQNTKDYNKMYFSYAGDGVGHTVKLGEKWDLETKYEIYKKLSK